MLAEYIKKILRMSALDNFGNLFLHLFLSIKD